jgi:uncharacterized protein YecE (DUF72 family)
MEIHIGCSGYYYNHWRGLFYPEDLPKKQWLVHYAQHFDTVEINNTFYRMPQENAVKNWYSITPEGFMFSVKAYRYFTHLRKLIIDNAFRQNLDKFIKLAGLLKEKAGPVLWQFPAGFKANLARLESLCRILPKDFSHVFEFRNETWFDDPVYDILEKYRHSLCIVSGPGSVPKVIRNTSPLTYIRFHGEGSWYRDNYSNEALQSWKKALGDLHPAELWAYFNNDVNANAVSNAGYFTSLYKKELVNVT